MFPMVLNCSVNTEKHLLTVEKRREGCPTRFSGNTLASGGFAVQLLSTEAEDV